MSVVLRVAVSGTADMDETEQLVYSQVLRPGYGAQLPLYTWLQYFSFALFGVNIFALSVLKYSLLFGTYACMLGVARRSLREGTGAAAAVLTLFLIPQVAWESYRTLSNTVLATFMASLTLLLFLRLREKPSRAGYVLLGAAAGLGMLTKYNYAIFLAALIAAGAATPVYRKVLLARRSLVSLLFFLGLSVPPYAWIVGNLDRATSSAGKLQATGGDSLLGGYLYGFASLAASTVGYLWPALLVVGAFLVLTRPTRETHPDRSALLLLLRLLAAALTVCSLLVLFFGVTYFKERWLQPVLFFTPVLLTYRLAPRLDRRRFRLFTAVTAAVALLAMASFSGSVLLAARTGRETRLSPPYRDLAARIENAGFGGGTIVAGDHRIGGNFRLFFSDSTVLVPGMMELGLERERPVLIVWNADRSETPPQGLAAWTAERFGVAPDPALCRHAEESMLYWEERSMRLGYCVIRP